MRQTAENNRVGMAGDNIGGNFGDSTGIFSSMSHQIDNNNAGGCADCDDCDGRCVSGSKSPVDG
ncbi:MAG: hypothetical protein WCX97_00345 [Candidatus Magasanikbacteria bacterium]